MENPAKINVKRNLFDWIIEILAFVSLLWSFYPLLFHADLPQKIPIRFNISGEAIQWAGRDSLRPPAMTALFFYIVICFLQRYPERLNYPVKIKESNLPKAYQFTLSIVILSKLLISAMFGFINYDIFLTATGHSGSGSLTWFAVAIAIGFAMMVVYPIVRLTKLK